MKDYSVIIENLMDGIITNLEEAYDYGYDQGYEDGKKASCDCKDNMEAEYNRGLNEAWDAAKWLYNNPVNLAEDIFNCDNWEIYSKYTAQEVVYKIKEYEDKKQQKQDTEQEQDIIKVGDEVVLNGNASYENEIGIILAYDGQTYPYHVLMSNGDSEWIKEDAIERKTGRHFDQIAEVLAEMRGEK